MVWSYWWKGLGRGAGRDGGPSGKSGTANCFLRPGPPQENRSRGTFSGDFRSFYTRGFPGPFNVGFPPYSFDL